MTLATEEDEISGRVTGPEISIQTGKFGVMAVLTFSAPEEVDISGLLRQIGSYLGRYFASRIEDGNFTRLAKSTLREKRLHGYPPAPLIRTGLLRDSLRQGGILDIQGNTLRVGTNVSYAAVQQKGGGKNHIPPRPYVAIGSEARTAISRLVDQFNAGLSRQQAEAEEPGEAEAGVGRGRAAEGMELAEMAEGMEMMAE